MSQETFERRHNPEWTRLDELLADLERDDPSSRELTLAQLVAPGFARDGAGRGHPRREGHGSTRRAR